jgi:hypothetical protein
MELNERIDKIMSNLPSSVEDLNYKYMRDLYRLNKRNFGPDKET